MITAEADVTRDPAEEFCARMRGAGAPVTCVRYLGAVHDFAVLDALSRTFSYLNQLLGLFCAGLALAWLAGIVGLIVVDLLAEGVIDLTHWSLSLAAPGTVTADLFAEGASRRSIIQCAWETPRLPSRNVLRNTSASSRGFVTIGHVSHDSL